MNNISHPTNYEQSSTQVGPDLENGDRQSADVLVNDEFLDNPGPVLVDQIVGLPALDPEHTQSERFEYGGSIVDFTHLETEKLSIAITEDRSMNNKQYLRREVLVVSDPVGSQPGQQIFIQPEGETRVYSVDAAGQRQRLESEAADRELEQLHIELAKLRARMLEHYVGDIDDSEAQYGRLFEAAPDTSESLRREIGSAAMTTSDIETPARPSRS